jgi:hypothetical protein
MPQYLAQLRKARSELGYSLQVHERVAAGAAAQGPHWVPLLTATLALLGIAWGAYRLLRWDPEPAAPKPLAPRGVGGWLLLPPLGMLINLVLTGQNLVAGWPGLQAPAWTAFGVQAQGLDAWLRPFLLFSGVAALVAMAGLLLSLWLFARRRSSLPMVYSGVLALLMGVQLVEAAGLLAIPLLAAQADDKLLPNTVKGMVFGAIWIAYFQRSGRVANTFTQRRRP